MVRREGAQRHLVPALTDGGCGTLCSHFADGGCAHCARLSYLPPVAVAAAGEVEPMVQVADAGGDKR